MRTRHSIAALGLATFLFVGASVSQAMEHHEVIPCRHWDKIVFVIADKIMAAELGLPYRSPLDIKVLDDPNEIADLKGKVLEFIANYSGATTLHNPTHIRIMSVEYAIECPSAAPVTADPVPTDPYVY